MTEPVSQDGNAAQIAYWNDTAARTWTALQAQLDAIFAPLTAVALDAANPRPDEQVLDVGCGCGATVLELARRVGPGGHVLGVDVSEPMTARAAERIREANLTRAQVLVADAATHDFAGRGADLLFSRFGVMFFNDPVAAFANLRQAMRPAGRLLFACWRQLAENPWFSLPLAATRDLLPPQPPANPDAPGPLAFADASRVQSILAAAGWHDATATRHDIALRLAPANDVAAAATFLTRVGSLARLLADADQDLRERARHALEQALQPYDTPDGVTLIGSVWIVSARAA